MAGNQQRSDVEVQQHKRQRVFLRKWQEGRPWLRTVMAHRTREVVSMYCDVCQKHPLKPPGPGKPNDTFIKGSTNFRLEAVIRHEASLVHQKAQEMSANKQLAQAENPPKFVARHRKLCTKRKAINKSLNPDRVTSGGKDVSGGQVILPTRHSEVIPLIRNAHAIALRGLQLSDYTWLCQLDEAKGLTLHPAHRTERSAQNFIHHIAQAERQQMKEAIHKSKFVSLIIDKLSPQEGVSDSPPEGVRNSPPDGAVEELIYLRSISEGHVTTHFIARFLTGHPWDEQRIYNSVVKETLQPYLATDDANVFSKIVGIGLNQCTLTTTGGAVHNVLRDVLLQRSPWLQAVHCNVTQIENCARAILCNTSMYRRIYDLLSDVYELYKNPLNRVALKVVSFAQSNRHKTFKVVAPPDLSQMTDSIVEVGSPEVSAQTGWMTNLLGALENLMESYSDITQHCQEGSSDTPEDADRMRRVQETLSDRDAVMFIEFVRDAVEEMRRLVVILRDAQTSLFNSYIVTKAAVSKLKLCLNSGGRHQSEFARQMTSSDGKFQGMTLRSTDDVTAREEIRYVVTSLCETLDAGFHDVTMDVLSATVIADLTQWPQTLQDDLEFGDECVKTLLKHFAPVLELAQVKLQRIEVEWNSIKVHLYNSSETVHQRSWSDINSAVGNKFGNFLALIDLVLVLPTYSAIREKGYQLVHQMRGDKRRTWDDCLKNDIITTVLHSGSIHEFNPKKAAKLWAQDAAVEVNLDHLAVEDDHEQRSLELSDDDSVSNSNHGDTDGAESYDDDVIVSHDVTEHKRPIQARRWNVRKTRGQTLKVQGHRKEPGTRRQLDQTPSVCDLCDVTFTSSRSLRHHKLIHHKLSPYQCEQCGKCLDGKTALTDHRRWHSGEKPHVCGVCGKRFRRSTDLKEHAHMHDSNRTRYPCAKCKKSFTQKIHLKYHQMTHTNNYRYYCDQCGKGFQMNCLLVRHKIRAHTHIKPYKCAVCDKSFKTNRDLRIHSDSHDPNKNYVCNQCGKMFQSKQLMEGHVMRIHEVEKLPLECATCGKRFRHRTMLIAHERVHTGETPFQCHTCGKTFKQKGHLTAHTRTHTGEKPYHCAVCDASFTVSCSLKKHMKFVHEGVKRHKNKADKKTTTEYLVEEPRVETQIVHLQTSRGEVSDAQQQHVAMATVTRDSTIMDTVNSSAAGHYSRPHQMAVNISGSNHQVASQHGPFSRGPPLAGPESEMGHHGAQPPHQGTSSGLMHRITPHIELQSQGHQSSVSGVNTLPPTSGNHSLGQGTHALSPGTHALSSSTHAPQGHVLPGAFWYMGSGQYEEQN